MEILGECGKDGDWWAERERRRRESKAERYAVYPENRPYIQYSHVRLCSVERKNPNVVLPSKIADIKVELLVEPKAREILYLLGTYPQVVRNAMENSEACTIVMWIFSLTHAVSSAWEHMRVQGVEDDLAVARLYLFLCTRDVLASAMRLLTLTPLDRM